MNPKHSAPDGGLFQSDLWKEFQKSLGKEIFTTPHFWGVIHKAPVLGYYGEVSRGPVPSTYSFEELSKSIQDIARENKLSLLRVEPQDESLVKRLETTNLHLRKAPLDVQPKEILMVDLEPSEEEIFAAMKSKTRYNIRLAQKKEVVTRPIQNLEEERQFLDLLADTACRKNLSFHKREYYQQLIQFFTSKKGETFVAVKDGKVLAGGIIIIFQKTAYYLHGGSSSEGRDAMAPHLLQWEQIRFAKLKGCSRYDFGGVSVKHQVPSKDWGGITRFKTGFAPNTETLLFPGTYDIVFSPLRYWSYLILSRFKKIIV